MHVSELQFIKLNHLSRHLITTLSIVDAHSRMKVIPYYPLEDDILAEIIGLKLNRIGRRIEENHKADFTYNDDVVEAVLARCTEVDSGARNVDHILNGTMLPEIAETVLARMAEGKPIKKVKIAVTKDSGFSYKIS